MRDLNPSPSSPAFTRCETATAFPHIFRGSQGSGVWAAGTTTGPLGRHSLSASVPEPPAPPGPAQRYSPSQPARRALSEKEAECGPPTSSRFPGGPTLPNQDWGHQLGLHKLPPRSTLKPFEELIKQVNDINTIVEGILNYLLK